MAIERDRRVERGLHIRQLLGQQVAVPGKDYVHQLNLIARVIGSPSEEEMEFITSDKAAVHPSLPRTPRVDFQKVYPAEPDAVDD